MTQLNHIAPLTGVRAVAAMMVLVGHAGPVLAFPNNPWMQHWYHPLPANGMSVFFTLSGFLMWVNYMPALRREKFGVFLANFSYARFTRIYPLYLLIVLLGLMTRSPQEAANAWPDLLWFFVLLQAWVPATDGKLTFMLINAEHTWSISTEMF